MKLGSDPLKELPPTHPADIRRAHRESQRNASSQAFDKASRELAAEDPQPQPQDSTAPHDNAEREMRFVICAPNPSYQPADKQRGESSPVRFSRGFGYTDDVATARQFVQRGLSVLDKRPGEPGGLTDEGVKHWRIEIPPGRRMAGKTFRDQSNLEFVEGLATTNHEPALYTARECGYVVVDQWAQAKQT